MRYLLCLPAILALAGCDAAGPAAETGPGLAITVAPLSLPGVTDATYTLTVLNGDDEVVWTKTVTSSAYGDGSGSVSVVGPCDADAPAHRVQLVLDRLDDASGEIAPATYRNPTVPTPVEQAATCAVGADTPVAFDLVIARDATQGFFDVAVSFSDIFCSGKLDCVDDDGPITLVHDPATGARGTTAVLAFACTAGAGADTHLYLDDVVLSCTGPGGPVIVTLDPEGGPGNAGPRPPVLFQHQIFRGVETLGGYNKAYWNLALGVDLDAMAAAGVHDCALTTAATAADPDAGFVDGVSPSGVPWPTLSWDVTLTDAAGALVCQRNALDTVGSGLTTVYGDVAGESFCHELTPDFAQPSAAPTLTRHCPTTITDTQTLAVNFAGNVLPAEWSLSTSGGGGIRNERLESQATNQSAVITHVIDPSMLPLSRLDATYYGQIRNSYWGSRNTLRVLTDTSGFSAMNSNEEYDHGNNNYAEVRLPGETETAPTVYHYAEYFPVFRYELSLVGDQVTFRIIDNGTEALVHEFVRTAPFDVSEVTSLNLQSYHTTDGGVTWVDDIAITLTHQVDVYQ